MAVLFVADHRPILFHQRRQGRQAVRVSREGPGRFDEGQNAERHAKPSIELQAVL